MIWRHEEFHSRELLSKSFGCNDLYRHRDARKGGHLPLLCVRHTMLQLLRGIGYIHREGYTHRDLKPDNILVTEWDSKTDFPTVKLADFGLAGINSNLLTICGTRGYVAPEIEAEEARQKVLQRREARGFKTFHRPYYYDNLVDIWALGKI